MAHTKKKKNVDLAKGADKDLAKNFAKKAPYFVQNVDYNILKDPRVTPEIDRFVRGGIAMRTTILALVLYAVDHLKPGMKVMDVGAGDSPYRTLFDKQEYKTSDFSGNDYHAYKGIDYNAPAHNLPVKDAEFDAIVCTEVLEHVPNPVESIQEFKRILKKGGQLFITTPFFISIHEVPYDYLRYTPFYFEKVLKENGFKIEFITPRGGVFSILASLLLGISLKPPAGNLRKKLIYFFLFLPIFGLPIFILKHGYARLAFVIDTAIDESKINTPGYAVHAIKL